LKLLLTDIETLDDISKDFWIRRFRDHLKNIGRNDLDETFGTDVTVDNIFVDKWLRFYTGDQCYDFQHIFAENFGKQFGRLFTQSSASLCKN
jgi:hypothetical protein